MIGIALFNQLVNKFEQRLSISHVFSRPLNVDVVITKACNLACVFCKDYKTEGAQDLSLENFRLMAAQVLPTARSLSICSGGEPYLHPQLEDMLRIAKSYGVWTWVLSNGMLLKKERMQKILEEGLIDEHGFSVDGIHPLTLESIRINAKLDKIIENIDMLIDLKSSLGVSHPVLVIRYALMRSNIEELPAAVEFWGKRGISKLNW
jgi:MoaA/NifB/PqqE/SkfB family radical SAM enzyme